MAGFQRCEPVSEASKWLERWYLAFCLLLLQCPVRRMVVFLEAVAERTRIVLVRCGEFYELLFPGSCRGLCFLRGCRFPGPDSSCWTSDSTPCRHRWSGSRTRTRVFRPFAPQS